MFYNIKDINSVIFKMVKLIIIR